MDVAAHQSGLLGGAAPLAREVAPTPPGYYSVDDVAAMLGVKTTTLQAWPSQGKGPPRTRAGNRTLYARDAFHHWLAGRQKAPPMAQPAG